MNRGPLDGRTHAWAKNDARIEDLERRLRALENPSEIRLSTKDGGSELVIRPAGIVLYARGRVAASLTTRPDGSVFTLYTSSGHPAAGIDVIEDSSAIRLFDSAGRSKAEIQVVDGVPEIYLLDENDNRRIEFDVVAGANVALSDAAGQIRIQLSVTDDGKVMTKLT